MKKLIELNEEKRAKEITKRITLLKQMDTYIRNKVDDEDLIIGIWLVYMPDEASFDDYESIAENDDSYYEMLEVYTRVTTLSGVE